MESVNTAIVYMLSDPVLPAHWWAIRALARGIAQHRLFVLYDSNASALANAHFKTGNPLANATRTKATTTNRCINPRPWAARRSP